MGVARDTRIVGNRIYDNADVGVHMYPDAQRTYVARNVIDSNGEGVLFGGTVEVAPRDNLVEHNLITNSRTRYNVESHFEPGGPIGENNVVRKNCIEGGVRDDGSGGIAAQIGFDAIDNVTRARPGLPRASPWSLLRMSSITGPSASSSQSCLPYSREMKKSAARMPTSATTSARARISMWRSPARAEPARRLQRAPDREADDDQEQGEADDPELGEHLRGRCCARPWACR